MEGKARLVVTFVLLALGILVLHFLGGPAGRPQAPDRADPLRASPAARSQSPASLPSPSPESAEAKYEKRRAAERRDAEFSLLVDAAASRYRSRVIQEVAGSGADPLFLLECEVVRREPMAPVEVRRMDPYLRRERYGEPAFGFPVLESPSEPPSISSGPVIAWQGAFRCVTETQSGVRSSELVYFPVSIVEEEGHRRLSPGTERVLDDPGARLQIWRRSLSERQDLEIQRQAGPFAVPTATPTPGSRRR